MRPASILLSLLLLSGVPAFAHASDEGLGYWIQPNGGDFDSDGDVDVSDYLHFQTCMNGADRPPTGVGCDDADLDQDADVDVSDYVIFQANFTGPRTTSTPTDDPPGHMPEPLSAVLTATALGGLVMRRRRA